jgi:hypothetical protein
MRPRWLLSYHYLRKWDLDEFFAPYEDPVLFADSGAFSAMTQDAQIDVDEYGEWVTRWGHLLTVYANLDVIGDAETTWVNQQVLEDRYGLRPLPVFHVREDWSWLDHYVERGYDYLALGVAGTRRSIYYPWLIKCFKILQGTGVRIHGFGITDLTALWDLPFYSVDSSSFLMSTNWGTIHLFNDRHRMQLVRRVNAVRHGRLVRAHGGDPRKIAVSIGHPDHYPEGYEMALTVSTRAFIRMNQHLRNRHGLIPAPQGQDQKGLIIYLADNARVHFPVMGRAFASEPELI